MQIDDDRECLGPDEEHKVLDEGWAIYHGETQPHMLHGPFQEYSDHFKWCGNGRRFDKSHVFTTQKEAIDAYFSTYGREVNQESIVYEEMKRCLLQLSVGNWPFCVHEVSCSTED